MPFKLQFWNQGNLFSHKIEALCTVSTSEMILGGAHGNLLLIDFGYLYSVQMERYVFWVCVCLCGVVNDPIKMKKCNVMGSYVYI